MKKRNKNKKIMRRWLRICSFLIKKRRLSHLVNLSEIDRDDNSKYVEISIKDKFKYFKVLIKINFNKKF